ncbi:MAG: response regulator [Pirellulales bacterium]|nr:response regulator [Pirellulales bacterium]
MVKTRLRILMVEDDPDHAAFVKRVLTQANVTQFEIVHVGCLSEAESRLRTGRFDAVLLDLGLPDARGFEALTRVHEMSPAIPTIVLTSNVDPAAGVEAASRGAQDYVCKEEISAQMLERAVRYSVQRQQILLELQKANELLDQRNSELYSANELLDEKNRHLASLCETAHQFVDNVSHEFRTPLTVIKEYTSLMRDGLAGQMSVRQREFLDIVDDRTEDLVIMVDDMLDASRLESGLLALWRRETKIADVFQHVRPTLERKARIKQLHFRISLEENASSVYCDPEKIGRVVVNLVTNAIKFCGEGGSVTLAAVRDPERADMVIAVSDNGPGIAPEHRELILERFQQVKGAARTSTKGFGLGLSIAKELVHLNLGEIRVESELGQGSTFSFGVPLCDPLELAARGLRHLAQIDGGSTFATLGVAEAAAGLQPRISDVLDELLQYVFRGNDLVVRVLPHKWLVLTRCRPCEVDQLQQRVRVACEEAGHGASAKLPEIGLRTEGTWQIPAQAAELLQRYRAELPAAVSDSRIPSVLVVDDDRELLCGLGIRLKAAGFEVLTALNGQAAVESARCHHPNAILLDNYMPVMDGLEALRRLGEDSETAGIPIIMLSAGLRDQQKALEQGARFFLQKPCSAQKIVDALHEVIAEPVAACRPGLTQDVERA